MATAHAVTKYIINNCKSAKKKRKLRALLYYSQANSFVVHGYRLFNDPMYADIKGPMTEITETEQPLTDNEIYVIDQVLDKYKKYSGRELNKLARSLRRQSRPPAYME